MGWTGLPASLNCSFAAAPGIGATMQMQPISTLGYVEQRPTEKELQELQKGENMIFTMITLVIVFSVLQIVCCCGVGAHSYQRWRKANGATPAVSAPVTNPDPEYPTVLTSTSDEKQ